MNNKMVTKISEDPWIGEIPEDWKEVKLKFLGKAIIGLTYSPEEVVDSSGTLVLRSNNINQGKIITNKTEKNVYVAKEIKKHLLVRENDLLICSRNGSRDLIGKVGQVKKEHTGYSFGAFTTIFRSPYNEFLYYMFRSPLFKSKIGSYLTSTINQLTTTNLRNMKVVLPNENGRRIIVKYLNKKIAEIDALIADKEKLIELLEEKRQAVITEAVTKGLDSDVPMKESGVEWIGEIPEHWRIIKAKYIFKQINEKNHPEENLLSVLKGEGLLPREELEFKAVMAFKGLENFKLVKEGDFVIHLRSFQSGFEMSTMQGIVSPAYTVFRPFIKVDNNYYKYVFYSKYFIDYIGSTTQSLRDGKPIAYDDFSSGQLMIPPEKEQKEISEYLTSVCGYIDESKELALKQLIKLKEYRQSLIYEAVTGKMDVQEMEREINQEEVSSS